MSVPKWEKQILKELKPVIKRYEELSPLSSLLIWSMTDHLRVFPLILKFKKFRSPMYVRRYFVFMYSYFAFYILYSDDLDRFKAQLSIEKDEREHIRQKTYEEIVTFFQSFIDEKDYYSFEIVAEDMSYNTLLDFFELDKDEDNQQIMNIGFLTVLDGAVDTLMGNLQQAKAKEGTQEFIQVMFNEKVTNPKEKE